MRKTKPCHCHKPAPLCDCPTNWAHCRDCQQPITWVKNMNNKNIPINGHVRVAYFNREQQTPHFATCPARQTRQIGRPKQTQKLVASNMPVNQLNLFAEAALIEIRALRDKYGGQS